MTANPHAYAVIMAGGRGERFWPLSTSAHPKQFLTLFGGKTLISQAVDRLDGLIAPERILVITSRDLVAATHTAAPSLPMQNIIGEPMGRDTAAACALACGLVGRRDPDGIACILTADHLMADVAGFRRTLADCITVAQARDSILTIGIQPTEPSTGFGYIEMAEKLETATATPFHRAVRFVEKPDLATATRYLADGKHSWNAGMFIWRCSVMRHALEQFTPNLHAFCRAVETAEPSMLNALLDKTYPEIQRISVDFAIMEHAKNIVVARGDFGWDDVGTWEAISHHIQADEHNNVVIGACEAVDSSDNVVVSQGRLTAVLGLKNVVVVQAVGVTLVCARDRVQDLKKLVQRVATRPGGGKHV